MEGQMLRGFFFGCEWEGRGCVDGTRYSRIDCTRYKKLQLYLAQHNTTPTPPKKPQKKTSPITEEISSIAA